MPKSVIAEGKTTNEAISKGLKQLNVSKDKVEIKVLENEKRSFFSILAPRVVKVELTVKENIETSKEKVKEVRNVNRKPVKKEYNSIEKTRKEPTEEEINRGKLNVESFLRDFAKNFEDINYTVEYVNGFLSVQIKGESSSKLIGYRGDVLNSLQTIINSVANKNSEAKIRVTLNIGEYKEKREKSLEELAEKIAKTVLKTGKSVTLEPMVAYERKIIHNRLQQNNLVKTYSVGDEPYRKVVISKNK